jgi:hypothetical protein
MQISSILLIKNWVWFRIRIKLIGSADRATILRQNFASRSSTFVQYVHCTLNACTAYLLCVLLYPLHEVHCVWVIELAKVFHLSVNAAERSIFFHCSKKCFDITYVSPYGTYFGRCSYSCRRRTIELNPGLLQSLH